MSFIEDEISREEAVQEKENKVVKTDKHVEKPKKVKEDDNHVEIDPDMIDKIIKKGIKETINLEPPSPPKVKAEEQTYFSGFNQNNQARKAYLLAEKEKPKKIIKPQNIDLRPEIKEDLVSHWDKKYGKAKVEVDKWGAEIPPNSDSTNVKKEVKAKAKTKKEKSAKPEYVENVLAHQPKTNGDDFEENWDDDDDAGNLQGTENGYNAYRHPDIPEIKNKEGKKKKKREKGKKEKPKKQEVIVSHKEGDEFEENWDD